jgi:hypothetical protein
MIQFLTENYQDLILYTTYFSVFFYFFLKISYQWIQYYSLKRKVNSPDPMYIGHAIHTDKKINETDHYFLSWLPKALCRINSSGDDEPDGVSFFKTVKRYEN